MPLPAAAEDDACASGSTLKRVFWLNLERRRDRAQKQLQALRNAGLLPFAQRVRAVDGPGLDLSSVPEEVLTAEVLAQVLEPPALGTLTPGAVGLWCTWYGVLRKILKTDLAVFPGGCYLVVEDDADYCDGFGPKLFRVFDALAQLDSDWHACAVGFIRSQTRTRPISEIEAACPENDIVASPLELRGASAILVNGARGAAAMLNALFPVGVNSPFDLSVSRCGPGGSGELRLWCTLEPLSEPMDSHIEFGDLARTEWSGCGALREGGVAQVCVRGAAPLASRTNPSHARRVHWPRRRRRLCSQHRSLEHLQRSDRGLTHVRQLQCQLQVLSAQPGAGPDDSRLGPLKRQLESALDTRDWVLQAALPHVPRQKRENSSKRLVLETPVWSAPPKQGGTFKKVLVMGLYHSCTNAISQELEKRFEVEVVNDWRTSKADAFWKHRVRTAPPPDLGGECLTVMMVKEPYFWIQSCSREPRNFFELRPFQVGPDGRREEEPPAELRQLLRPVEHAGVVYSSAVGLWNDTVASYFDDDVYPPRTAVVVRCEDFLFRFHGVLDELSLLGLPERRRRGSPPEPFAGRAKNHMTCRTREEALDFYAQPSNRFKGLSPEQVETVAGELDGELLARLGYGGRDPVATWAPRSALDRAILG